MAAKYNSNQEKGTSSELKSHEDIREMYKM